MFRHCLMKHLISLVIFYIVLRAVSFSWNDLKTGRS